MPFFVARRRMSPPSHVDRVTPPVEEPEQRPVSVLAEAMRSQDIHQGLRGPLDR
jgi:hypothetical protein